MKEKLTIGTHNNNPVYWDFSKSPHLVVLGQTGAGKTFSLYSIIEELINENAELYGIDLSQISFYSLRNIFTDIADNKETVTDLLNRLYNITDTSKQRFLFFENADWLLDDCEVENFDIEKLLQVPNLHIIATCFSLQHPLDVCKHLLDSGAILVLKPDPCTIKQYSKFSKIQKFSEQLTPLTEPGEGYLFTEKSVNQVYCTYPSKIVKMIYKI